MYLFLIGTGRCGSSFIHQVLARHPDIGFVSNLEDRGAQLGLNMLGRHHDKLYRRISPEVAHRLRPRYVPSEAYRLLNRRVSPALSVSLRDLRVEDATPWLEERTRSFFEERRSAQEAAVFSHKFTGWPRARFLAKVFPEARFVHVVRDGRAVANSLLQMPWWGGYRGPSTWSYGPLPSAYQREWEWSNYSFIVLAGLTWKVLIDAFREAEQEIVEDRWLTLRYEDVVEHPRDSFESLLQFARLPWTSMFERQFARYTFSTARTHAFRRDLGTQGLAQLEKSLAEHLTSFEYETSLDGP